MPGRFTRLLMLTPLLVLLSGCTTVTYVEGGLSPRHFHFYEVVARQNDDEPGGWRAACLEVGTERNNTGELFYCTFGVEVPIANEKQGELPIGRVQSIAASCANQAARMILATVTPATPMGVACEEFKTLYDRTLGQVISGARVMKRCRKGIPSVRLTPSPSITP